MTRRPMLASLLPALLALAGGGAAEAKPAHHGPASWPTVSRDGEPGHDELLAQTDEIVAEVAKLRSLVPLHPVARGVLGRAAITSRIQSKLDESEAPGELDAEARVDERLGLLPAGTDYHALLVKLLGEQIAGFYDPDTKELYVADWMPMAEQRPALAHEIGHALVDQHFDLTRFDDPLPDDGDRQQAQSALVEGDGTLVMMQFVGAPFHLDLAAASLPADTLDRLIGMSGASGEPVFASAPRFLQEELLFPYFAGLELVLALYRSGSWAAIDRAYADPPTSTAQILHPEKYLAHEAPIAIAVPERPLVPGAKELKRDVLGELGLRLFLETYLPDPTARAAAVGWAGDRLVAYTEEGRRAGGGSARRDEVVDLSVWESDASAAHAFTALGTALAHMAGAAAPCGDASLCVYRKGEDAFAVEKKANEILFSVGAAPSAESALRAAAWDGLKVAGAPRPARPARR